MIPVSIPGNVPGNYGKSQPWDFLFRILRILLHLKHWGLSTYGKIIRNLLGSMKSLRRFHRTEEVLNNFSGTRRHGTEKKNLKGGSHESTPQPRGKNTGRKEEFREKVRKIGDFSREQFAIVRPA